MQVVQGFRGALVAAAGVLALAATLGACGDDDADAAASPSVTPTVAIDTELRDELLAMLKRDQSQRAGAAPYDLDGETDEDRTRRLQEIIEEHGWPGYDLVGAKGEDAAWAIAQHSDLDPVFQAEALELLRAAVEAGQASSGNLAYLEDRVAVSQGRPQVYGTQVGCATAGPEPATPIEEPEQVDERRAEAGLEPLDDYLAEMRELCSQDD